MNPLQLRLAALRRRLFLVVSCRGVSLILAILVLAPLAMGWVDWQVPGHLPSLVRAFLLVSTVTLAGGVAYRYLVRPLRASSDDLSLALRVESCYPILNDSLASAVQFLEQPAQSERSGSPSLRREAVDYALDLAEGLDFDPVVDTRGVGAAGLSVAVVTTLALVSLLAYPQIAWTALFRWADPFGGHEWPRQTRLEITAPARLARGEAFEMHGRVQGVIPEKAWVEFRFANEPPLTQEYAIQQPEGAEAGTLTARLETSRVQRDFRFQVRANDALSAWYDVAVLPPPQLVPLAGRPSPQMHLRFPDYTDLGAIDLPDGASNIEAAAGTQVRLRAAADRPLARAWLEYPSAAEPVLKLAALLAALGVPQPTGILELAAGRLQDWQRIPARLEADGRVLALDFTARISGTFALHFEDDIGMGNTRLVELHTVPDPAPLVHLERPSRSRDSLDLLPDAEITLLVHVEDVRYAIRSVYLDYRHKQEATPAPAGAAPARAGRLLFYDHAALGNALPHLLAAAGPLPIPLPSLRLRPSRLESARRWSLRELGLREGDVLVLQASADDFDDVTVGKEPGRSHEVELRIVGRTTLELALDAGQAQIQQELLRLHKQQQEALAKVVPAETRWRNEPGRLTPKHLDELLQAEQLQQQIQARVGTTQEGLRAEVARIMQALQDNQQTRTGAQGRMATVAAELERLAREELNQIESQLTEARKQSETGGTPSASEPNQSPLTEARSHQQEAERTLAELLKLLEPWSSTREVKGEANAVLQAQRKVAEETAGLARALPLSTPRDRLKPAQKADLDRTEEAQRNLAERAGQLLDKLKRLAAERANREPEMAKQLAEAASRGEENDVTGKMRDAELSIRKLQLAKAGNEQLDSTKALDQIVRALEDRREEDLDRLIKKMKEAEQKLADLVAQQDQLRAKAKEAGQLADPKEREEALKRLTREQERLQREVQDQVRELSRLRAQRASQALREAGASMQRAGQQMDKGENPGEQQDETLDRLNEGQQRLQEAREEVEEELAREKLTKLADQLKGVRERQEALIAESGRIQRELLQRKHWVRQLQASLRSLGDVQQNLSEETQRAAEEKLGGTKVFAHLLTKSAQAMHQASERMMQRLEAAREHIDNVSAGEEPGLDLPAEETADAKTQDWQRAALRRIDHLLEALKPDAESPPRQAAASQQSGGQPGSGAGGEGGEGDGSLAQLKALRTLQHEINEQTRAFDKEHPDREKLTKDDADALGAIRKEQVEIADLFQQLTVPEAEDKQTRRRADRESAFRFAIAVADDPPLDPAEPPVRLKKKVKPQPEGGAEQRPDVLPKKEAPPVKTAPPPKPAEPKENPNLQDMQETIREITNRVAKNMSQAEERLQKKDPGEVTQHTQAEIVRDLDELIEQTMRQQQRRQAQIQSSSNARERRDQQARRSRMPQKSAADDRSSQAQNPGQNNQNGNNPGEGKAKQEGMSKLADLYKDVWGHLPETLRQEMDQYSREQFMAKYADLLKQYYATIAEKGRRKEEP